MKYIIRLGRLSVTPRLDKDFNLIQILSELASKEINRVAMDGYPFETIGSTNWLSVSQGNRIQVSWLTCPYFNKWLIHKAFPLISIDNRYFREVQ